MADNLEIRVEQLTDAIRGLYNKPSLTPAEINNAFNTMLQRFENQTNLSTEKMLQIIVNEIKRTAEERQGNLQEMLYNFEGAVKNAAAQITNPKFEMQMSKLDTDLNSLYTKVNNQELQFQKFTQTLDALRTSGTAAEMVKLSNDFAAFSRGFDNITNTLNKNFAEFLEQVQSFSQKEELNQIKYNLEEIIKNSANITSAGEKIDTLANRVHNLSSKEDTNYINEKITILTSFLSDLKAYMEKNDMDNKEQFRSTIANIEQKLDNLNFGTIDEIKGDIKNLFNEIRNTATYSKDEIIAKFADIVDIINKSYTEIGEKLTLEQGNVNNNLAQLTGEVERVCAAVTDGITGRSEEIKIQLQGLNDDFQNFKNALVELSSNINIDEAAKSIIQSNSETLELSHDFIQSQIGKIEEALQRQEEADKQHLVNAIELLKTEFGQMSARMSEEMSRQNSYVSERMDSLEAGIQQNHNDSPEKLFEEPLNRISKCVESLESSDTLRQFSEMLSEVTNDINVSITNLKDNFEKAQDGSSIAVLQQLNDTVPKISDKLEIFRNHVVSENSANITELKQHFAQVVDTITSRVEGIAGSIKDDFQSFNSGGLDSVKVDLQNMSNHIMETIENINFNITREFNDHKTNIDEVLSKITDYEDKFRDKLNSIESTFETLSQEGTDRINDAISLSQLQVHETLNTIKSDILAGILGINKNSKTNFEMLDVKLEKLIKKSVVEANQEKEKSSVTSLQEASQQELLAEIENKVERCNLQQIHNGKELLSEIQNLNSELSFKIESLHPSNNDITPSLIRGIDDKVQSILEANVDKEEYVKLIKAHMDLRMKEVIQKIAKIVSVFRPDAEKEEDAQKVAASVKLDGLLPQLEYLKDNTFAEIKEGFDRLDKKEEILSDIYKNVGEALSNTVYIKNNAANEFKGVLEEKLENIKNVEFLIEDLKNAIQNNQTNTLERINSLNEDVNSTRSNVNEKVDAFQNVLSEKTENLQNILNDKTSSMRDILNERTENLQNILDERSEHLQNKLAEKVDNIQNSVAENVGDIRSAINDKAIVIQNIVNERANTMQDILNERTENIQNALDDKSGSLHSAISEKTDSIKDIIIEKSSIVQNVVSERIENIQAAVSEKIGDIRGSVNDNVHGLHNALSEKFDYANQRLDEITGNILDKLNSGFNDTPNNVAQRVMDDIGNRIEEEGYQVSERTIGDISSKIDMKMDRIKEVICDDIKSAICLKIDTNTIDSSDRIIKTVNDSSEEVSQRIETIVNEASERIASTVIDNIKHGLGNIESQIGNIQKRGASSISSSPLSGAYSSKISDDIMDKLNDISNLMAKKSDGSYSMSDLEADLAKLRFSLEKSNKNIGADFQNIGGWLKNTNSRLDGLARLIDTLSKKVENTEKSGIEEIKAKLIQNERNMSAPQKVEEILANVQKKYKIQEMRLEELDEKITQILQKQSEGFDVKSFIDLFYDNTTQTKSLTSRVDAIENKLNSISKNIEKIISYIDE